MKDTPLLLIKVGEISSNACAHSSSFLPLAPEVFFSQSADYVSSFRRSSVVCISVLGHLLHHGVTAFFAWDGFNVQNFREFIEDVLALFCPFFLIFIAEVNHIFQVFFGRISDHDFG
jgi:hypothetical protein